MIEPAAYGAAVSFGPATHNFRDVVALLLSAGAATVVRDGDDLTAFVTRLPGASRSSSPPSLVREPRQIVAASAAGRRKGGTMELWPAASDLTQAHEAAASGR